MISTATILVGRINGHKVKYDGINYYVTINGRNYAIDYKNKRDQQGGRR